MNRNQNAILRKKTANLHAHAVIRVTTGPAMSRWYFGAFYSQNGVSV